MTVGGGTDHSTLKIEWPAEWRYDFVMMYASGKQSEATVRWNSGREYKNAIRYNGYFFGKEVMPLRTLELNYKAKTFCQKCRAARHRFSKHWIWVHQILFACKWHCISKHRVWVHTPQTHLLGASRLPARSALLLWQRCPPDTRAPKTPKRKDGNYRKKNREN